MHILIKKGAHHLLDELGHHRTVINWVFMFLYIWVVVYSVKHYPESVTTAITVTGGLVTAIFTNYVWSRHMDSKNPVVQPPVPVQGQDDGQKKEEDLPGAI
jgi:4-hydroxybenzoate polyprenyltransferase